MKIIIAKYWPLPVVWLDGGGQGRAQHQQPRQAGVGDVVVLRQGEHLTGNKGGKLAF